MLIPGSGDECLKVMGYTDDICVFCKFECDVRHVKLLVNVFCLVSAFKINWMKSGMKTFFTSDIKDQDTVQAGESIKVLGINFEEDLKGQTSWENTTSKITRKLNMWRLRELSFT